ncbi:HAD-IIIA family hydrolase [bacterium]|nr:HAD-IIIA family hydrolase [bacterium]
MKNKIMTLDELKGISDELRRSRSKVGYTSGAFDILHAGHVDYLEKAKACCDILIVGVNSDSSIKQYKGKDRPINPETQRLKVVAGLESVDYVFLFKERRNRKNIEALKPDFYIKAGDYTPDKLTSKDVVESYGGKVILIPLVEQVSSSHIIDKISLLQLSDRNWINEHHSEFLEVGPSKTSRAVFLDRDGTINREINYLHEPEKFELLPGVIEGLIQFQSMGYRLVIITNQPGIGLGYYTKEDFYRVNLAMLEKLSAHGILIEKIYFCPHSKAEKCACRKPGQLLIHRAKDQLNLDMRHSVFIGDRPSDIEAGIRAGMLTIHIKEGGTADVKRLADYQCNTLEEAACWLQEHE